MRGKLKSMCIKQNCPKNTLFICSKKIDSSENALNHTNPASY